MKKQRPSASGFLWPVPDEPVPTTCSYCGERDVRPEDGRHDWHTCGLHLLEQRNEARAELRAIHEEYASVKNEGLTRDALELKLALIQRERDDAWGRVSMYRESLHDIAAKPCEIRTGCAAADPCASCYARNALENLK